MNHDRLMTPNEVAEYIKLHPETLRRYARKKDNPLIPIRINTNGHRRFFKSQIDNYFLGEK